MSNSSSGSSVDPVLLVHSLRDRFRRLGVTSPEDRLFVDLAWLRRHTAEYLETIRIATEDMTDEDALITVLNELDIQIGALLNYAESALPEVKRVLREH